MNPHEFLKLHKVVFTAERVNKRPDNVPGWGPTARHWRFTFSNPAHGMVGHFSQGEAHTRPPTDIEVLEALSMDARAVDECRDVLDFANEFCFEVDTHEDRNHTRNIFELCQKTADDLRSLFGEDGYEDLLEVEFDR